MTDAIQELYDERVAIMIHDGNVPEADAIKQAFFEVKRITGVKVMPDEAIRELKEMMEGVSNAKNN